MSQEGTALEESPETFFARFQAHAVEVHLFPEPWGSPLLEVGVGGFILYAFDRGAPPAPTGRVRALLHGVAREVKPWEGEELMGPAYRIGGKALWERGFTSSTAKPPCPAGPRSTSGPP
jgi:hypothetical protein